MRQSCFTDFPFPAEAASHSTSADVQRYLEDYVEHFNLRPRLRLGTSVGFIRRNVQNDMWELEIEGEESQFFNKIVIATGICQVPVVPELPGSDKFKGEMIHSRAFKRYAIETLSSSGADIMQR